MKSPSVSRPRGKATCCLQATLPRGHAARRLPEMEALRSTGRRAGSGGAACASRSGNDRRRSASSSAFGRRCAGSADGWQVAAPEPGPCRPQAAAAGSIASLAASPGSHQTLRDRPPVPAGSCRLPLSAGPGQATSRLPDHGARSACARRASLGERTQLLGDGSIRGSAGHSLIYRISTADNQVEGRGGLRADDRPALTA